MVCSLKKKDDLVWLKFKNLLKYFANLKKKPKNGRTKKSQYIFRVTAGFEGHHDTGGIMVAKLLDLAIFLYKSYGMIIN